MKRFFLALTFLACMPAVLDARKTAGGDLSPLDFGWKKAKTGEARYEVLYKTHKAALEKGVSVDYTGLKKIQLSVPADAESIPLGRNTDFKGAEIHIYDDTRDFCLFTLSAPRKRIKVTGKQIDSKDYSQVKALASGLHLLLIEDMTPWVLQRENRPYGATRREAVLVRDGVGSNGPCAPYDTPATDPRAYYADADDGQKTFCNVTFIRNLESTKKAHLVRFEFQNNVRMSGVKVVTPPNDMHGDHCITFFACTNILCEDIVIDGTYSQPKEYGYGITLNAVWNSRFHNLRSNCAWGVFGNNNTHDSYIEDCDIERYDTHCYGRNIFIRNCTLNGRGLPVSSIFGTILLEDCKLNQCYPYACRADYYSYVDFDLYIRNCVVEPRSGSLISLGRLDDKINERPELVEKRWPNVYVENVTVKVPRGAIEFSLLRTNPTRKYDGYPLSYMSRIHVDGLQLTYDEGQKSVPFKLCNFPVNLTGKLDCSVRGISGATSIVLNVHGTEDSFDVDPGSVPVTQERRGK